MSPRLILKALVKERLVAAAEEIFLVFESAIVKYEEEICTSKKEIERLKGLLVKSASKQETGLFTVHHLIPRAVSPCKPSRTCLSLYHRKMIFHSESKRWFEFHKWDRLQHSSWPSTKDKHHLALYISERDKNLNRISHFRFVFGLSSRSFAVVYH